MRRCAEIRRCANDSCNNDFLEKGPNNKYCSTRCCNEKRKTQDNKHLMLGKYDNIPNRNSRGALSELIVCADLLAKGYMAFRNLAPVGSVDLIALEYSDNKVPLRIEVKSVESFVQYTGKKYKICVHFDHVAKVKRSGEIEYEPNLKTYSGTPRATHTDWPL